jgi:hypothetical protein
VTFAPLADTAPLKLFAALLSVMSPAVAVKLVVPVTVTVPLSVDVGTRSYR